MTPSSASLARWRETVLLGCPVAAASVRTEGKQRPVRSANATRFCSVQCRCRRTLRYRSRVTGMNDSKRASLAAGAVRRGGVHRAHTSCGANLALESADDLGEAHLATEDFPRFAGNADPPLRRVLLFRCWCRGLAE